MLYIITTIFFVSFFLFFSLFFLMKNRVSKNYKRKVTIERKLLWKLPRAYRYIYAVSPKTAEAILTRSRERQIEEDLVILLEDISSNLTGGVSVTDTISSSLQKLRAPLKNELSLFLILSREHGSIRSLEHSIKKSRNVFLRIFWMTILTHYKNGGALADNLRKLHRTLYLRLNIKGRINAQLLNTKVQMAVGTALPYFLFLVMNVLYPYLIKPVLSSSLGVGLLLFAFILHGAGVYFFSLITRFNMSSELNYSMVFEHMSFSMRNGLSIATGINGLKQSGLLSRELEQVVSSSGSTPELISNMAVTRDPYIQHLAMILKRGHSMGIAIADDLSGKASDITEKLEQRALRFQQVVPSKALIPLLLCIFPATYLLILTPIIVEVSLSNF